MAIDIKTLALALAMFASAGCAALKPAQQQVQAQAETEVAVPASTSVQQADARLAEAASVRAAAESRFLEREQVCYTLFFVNNCLDQAKDERHAALEGLRPIEIEASRFKRAHAVEQRDIALEVSNAKTDAQPPVARPAKTPAPPAAIPKARAPRQQKPAAVPDDAKRAANVVAYEKKRAASLQRQREIAAKQAERDAKEASKEAARKP
jgi:colicin import membrane protein